jgi:hypothetical protein
MFSMTVYLLSQSDIGNMFGVSGDAVRQWRKRYPPGSEHPFPEPDAWTGVDAPPERAAPEAAREEAREGEPEAPEPDPGLHPRSMPGWLPKRRKEIRAWHREYRRGQGARTDLA